ncbi:hypothetical protein [Prescottella equi]|uniref:hypothetical protein n=1 Tax=Rhodococcus hoagii TaxID=43767 RepID=UPI0007CD7726|nr:hypothetical protein [Prescottella equi]
MTETIDDDGFRWPHWMAYAPANVPPALFAVTGIAGSVVGFPPGWWRLIPIGIMATAFAFAWAIDAARSSREDRDYRQVQRERDEARAQLATLRAEFNAWVTNYRASLLHYDLHNLLVLVATAVATNNRQDRASQARTARQSIICAAARLIGESEQNGTRANLFLFETPQLKGSADTSAAMSLEPGAFHGRGVQSSRRFAWDHPTTLATLKNKAQFVIVSELEPSDDPDDDVPYAAYATHPVSVNDQVIHGVLTVDSMSEGVLEEKVDLPMMAVLSDLIAITLECEKYPKRPEPRQSVTSIEFTSRVRSVQRGFA